MANSVLEAIETSVVATMLAVSGITAAKAVPASEMFKEPPTDAQSFWLPTMPDAYPGAVVSLNDGEVEAHAIKNDGDAVQQQPSAASIAERVPVYVAIYATSDGTTQTTARYLAWQITEAAKKAITLSGVSGIPAGSTFFYFEYEMTRPIVVDSNTHGMLMKIWAVYKTRWIA